MARSGKKSISIEAPIMITSDKVAVWMDDACMCILHLMLVCNYASYLVCIACVVGACLYAWHLLYACVYKCMCTGTHVRGPVRPNFQNKTK